MGERLAWLDMARGAGIAAVVVGHVTSDADVRGALFHFHMPLFFMLAGMMFVPAPVWQVARRRASTLLAPYACWLAVVALVDIVIASFTAHPAYLPWGRPLIATARLILGGTFLVGPFGVFWFVTCLFGVQLAGAAILRRPRREVLIAAAVLFLCANLVPHLPSPWGLASMPCALFFFIVGALYNRHELAGRPHIIALAIGAAALSLVSRPLDIKIADAGTPVLGILAALGLCHLIIVAAQNISPIKVVATLGRASLVIMYLHLTIFYALRDHLGEMAVITLSLGAPAALWMLLRKSSLSRRFLLGERPAHRADPGLSPPAGMLPLGNKQA